jgi:hypothetical protein
MSAGAIVILALVLISFDERVRDYAWGIARSTSAASAQAEITGVGRIVFGALRDQTMTHAPLTIFVVAGAILFLFMVKT